MRFDPKKPLRSHHRFMLEMLKALKPKARPAPEELNVVARVFERAGGSWVNLTQGSTDDVLLLRKCLKVGLKKGFITKAPKWGE